MNFEISSNQKAYPLSAFFELTHRCNLNCIHCYVVKGDSRQELGVDKILDILEQLKERKCLFLHLTGGELFVRKDWFSIAAEARKLMFALYFHSNATLIDSDTAYKIKELNPLDVYVTLYGATKKTYEKVTRVEGSFQQALSGIENLSKRKINLRIRTLLLKYNFSELGKLRRLARKLCRRPLATGFFINPSMNGSMRPLSSRISDLQRGKYLRVRFNDIKKQVYLRKYRDDYFCGAARYMIGISPYGDIYPCSLLRMEGNNIFHSTLQDIWDNSKEFNLIRNTNISDIKECYKCSWKYYCPYCHGVVFLGRKKFMKPLRYFCSIAKNYKKYYDIHSLS